MKNIIIKILLVILINRFASSRVIELDNDEDENELKNHRRSKRHIKQSTAISGAENLYSCIDKECIQIHEFKIAKNYTVNCYKNDILITFDITTVTIKTRIVSAYLRKSLQGVFVSDESSKDTTTCKMIKKYYINQKEVILVIGETIYQTEIRDLDNFIFWTLLVNRHFETWIYWVLDIYNETDLDNSSIQTQIKNYGLRHLLIYILLIMVQKISRKWMIIGFRYLAKFLKQLSEEDDEICKNAQMLISIPTAISNPRRCIVCKKRGRRRKIINKESIAQVFIKKNIIIPKYSYCCRDHLDKYGFLKSQEYNKIAVVRKLYDSNSISTLKAVTNFNNQIALFDKFKNFLSLSEEDCINITGWSKIQFRSFADYIKSINSNKQRNKYQLIALYRYWLLKGINQKTLSYLKSDTTQQQISHYLDQIRNAIYKDFVPFFLGAQSKSRDQFLLHNNQTAKELFKLNEDMFAAVADGSYIRIERSSNNDFQYNTYSKQKKSNLFKPFLLCCSDGYIIDAYGPFEAKQNDASILQYILETDQHLNQLLIRNLTTFFLDRGFRDIVRKLENDYAFNVKIPTCHQFADNKQILTPEQANNNRMVSKVRFIVEHINGHLKNMKTLDQIRNIQAGHIMIDYRIACAMLNFTLKPCTPDRPNSLQIATKLQQATQIKKNKLHFLLKPRGSVNLFRPVDFDFIKREFPKLSKLELESNITLGTYHSKLSKSYIDEFSQPGEAFINTDALKDDDRITLALLADLHNNRSKILKVNIVPRYSRSTRIVQNQRKFITLHKVFIEYSPDLNGPAGIKGYICSCQSGQKTAGSCVHVTTAIRFFSEIIHNLNNFKPPAKYLKEALINMNNNQLPNRPLLARNKRAKYVYF